MTTTLNPVEHSTALEPRELPRCGAKLVSGKPCRKYPVKGTNRCERHGGGAPQVRAKAREILLRARVNRELVNLGSDAVVDPLARYAELAGEIVAFKDLARRRVNELHSWEHEGAFDSLDVHAAVVVYERALDRAERILGRMSSLGLTADLLREALHLESERPTREQVEVLANVLNRVLADKRVSVDSGVARSVVVDAMKAEGLG